MNKPTANEVLPKAELNGFADIFVQGGSSVLRMKFSAKTPRHRKPPKRYRQVYDDSATIKQTTKN